MIHVALVCMLLQAAGAIVANTSGLAADRVQALQQHGHVQFLAVTATFHQKSCSSSVASEFSPIDAASATSAGHTVAIASGSCPEAQCVTSQAVLRGLANRYKWIVEQPLCVPDTCVDNTSLLNIGDALFERDLKTVFYNDSYFAGDGPLPGERDSYDGALVIIVIDCSSATDGAKVEVANHVSFMLHSLEQQAAENMYMMAYAFATMVFLVTAMGLFLLYLRHRERAELEAQSREHETRSQSIRERAILALSRANAAAAA